MTPESYLMPMMALIILYAALTGGTAGNLSLTSLGGQRSSPAAREQQVVRVEGEILLLDVDRRRLLVRVDGRADDKEEMFQAAPDVTVIKEGKEVELSALAVGDSAVLQLAGTGSDVVTRIQTTSR